MHTMGMKPHNGITATPSANGEKYKNKQDKTKTTAEKENEGFTLFGCVNPIF